MRSPLFTALVPFLLVIAGVSQTVPVRELSRQSLPAFMEL